MTFVDFAEFIWKQTGTQQQTADVLGWSRGKVSQYDMLDNISKEAWAIIATTFEELGKLRAETVVADTAPVCCLGIKSVVPAGGASVIPILPLKKLSAVPAA